MGSDKVDSMKKVDLGTPQNPPPTGKAAPGKLINFARELLLNAGLCYFKNREKYQNIDQVTKVKLQTRFTQTAKDSNFTSIKDLFQPAGLSQQWVTTIEKMST